MVTLSSRPSKLGVPIRRLDSKWPLPVSRSSPSPPPLPPHRARPVGIIVTDLDASDNEEGEEEEWVENGAGRVVLPSPLEMLYRRIGAPVPPLVPPPLPESQLALVPFRPLPLLRVPSPIFQEEERRGATSNIPTLGGDGGGVVW